MKGQHTTSSGSTSASVSANANKNANKNAIAIAMKPEARKSRYNLNDNCSIVQIKDGQIYLFGKRIYNIVNPRIDYPNGYVEFYQCDPDKGDPQSLNQASQPRKINLDLLIGWEVIHAFDEIDKQNLVKIEGLFEK